MASAGGAAVDEWAGFYYFAPTTGTDFYVADAANGGSDSNDGLTTGTPKLTVAAGLALLTSGQPDRLWFHRGSSWTGEHIGLTAITGGLSATEPMIIGAYGDYTLARPHFECDTIWMSQTAGVSFLVIQDLDIELEAARTTTGVKCFNAIIVVDTFIVQGCRIHNFANGIEADGDLTGVNFIMHRNVISDIWSDGGGSGLLLREMIGYTITGNVFDRCGYSTSAFDTGNGNFRDVYINSSNTGAMTFADNWAVRSASNGAQFRSGGDVLRNGFISNRDGFTYAITLGGATPCPAATGDIHDNYVDDSFDLTGVTTGFGIQIGNTATGATLERNLITNCSSAGTTSWGLQLNGGLTSGASTMEITGLDVRDNVVFETERPLMISGAMGTQIDGVVVEDNEWGTSLTGATDGYAMHMSAAANPANITFSGNAYQSGKATNAWIGATAAQSVATWAAASEADAIDGIGAYTDSTRTVETYLDDLLSTSGSTKEDFFDALRLQRRGAWVSGLETRSALNWIRAGFDMAAIA